jgi:hypothetical protein
MPTGSSSATLAAGRSSGGARQHSADNVRLALLPARLRSSGAQQQALRLRTRR